MGGVECKEATDDVGIGSPERGQRGRRSSEENNL